MKSIHFLAIILTLGVGLALCADAQTIYRTTPSATTTAAGPYPGTTYPLVIPADKNIKIYPSSTTSSYSQSEFTVAAHPTDVNKLFVGANTTNGAVFYQGYYYSNDGGLSWSGGDMLPGTTQWCSDPAVAYDASGNVFFNYLQRPDAQSAHRLYVNKSTNNGASWGTAVQVPTNGNNDKEHFVADLTASSPFANYLYTAYSDFSFANPPIYFSRSTNGGTSFTTGVNISGSVTGNVAQGVNLAVASNGTLYAAWSVFDGAQNNGESAIGFNKSTNGGASWTGATRILNIQGICNFSGWTNHNPQGAAVRVNGFPSMAVDRSTGAYAGYIYIVWADKRYDHSDILLTKSTNGGSTWSAPIRVNQDTQGNGKDQWLPWIAVNPDGIVNVTFFDSRNDANNMYVENWVAYSADGGTTFKDYRANDFYRKFYWYPVLNNGYAGDYNGIAATKQYSFPVWADPRNNGTTVQAYTHRFGTYNNVANVYGAWQMTSLPNYMHDTTVASVYPTRTNSTVTTYNVCTGAYDAVDPMYFSLGYWVKFGVQQNITYIGDPVYSYAMQVQTCGTPAWNMIGSISKSVSTSSIVQNPAGNVASSYFTTNSSGGYVATSVVDPGMGIWVKVNQPGTLTMSATAPKAAPVEDPYARVDKFTITDAQGHVQDMYVRNGSLAMGKAGNENIELPPPPPDRFFSVRFASDNYLQSVSPAQGSTTLPIELRNVSFPITLSWDCRGENAVTYTLTAEGTTRTLTGTGSISIASAPDGALDLKASAGIISKPAAYALAQNYPNPFNPQTSIRYALAEAGPVHLVLFDLLGREVKTLVNEVQEAGYHAVTLDGTGLSSGVYFYSIKAGKFSDVKKMVLMK